MSSTEQATRIYRELAEDYGRQGQAQMRDRFLVLAADAALASGRQDEAEHLRGRLLQHNPHHLLKPYGSFSEAMKSSDVQNYVSALRRSHPYEKAENLLEGMRQSGERAGPGIPPAGEDLKVFRVLDPADESKASPSRPAANIRALPPGITPAAARPAVPSPPSPASTSARPVSAPEILALRREPYPALDKLRPGSVEGSQREPSPVPWVSTALFLLTLVLGIGWGTYTLIRPFLPEGWF